MVYEVPDFKKSIKQNKFLFRVEGVEHEATRFDLLPTTFIESIGEIEEKRIVKVMRLALAGADEGLAEKLGEMPIKALQDLIAAWQKDGGIELGESSASDS